MRTLEIEGTTGHSMLYIGERLENVKRFLPDRNVFIVTDETVERLYKDRLPSFPIITIGEGERIKTIDTVQSIYRSLLKLNADRNAFILGIGGGVVCDIAGFAASTFLRGVRFGFIPTTLLAQVDASVGGKNGVNLDGYKNMIGLVNQPEFVICDMNVLRTLSEKDKRCGFAEIIKHAVIYSPSLIDFLEHQSMGDFLLSEDVIETLVYESILIKSEVVRKDEKEMNERRKLNFGHTFGHAIESLYGIPHGEAVSVGMSLAAKFSVLKNKLSEKDLERFIRLMKQYSLPTDLSPYDPLPIVNSMTKDKKRTGDHIYFILLNGLGNASIEQLPIQDLYRIAYRLFS